MIKLCLFYWLAVISITAAAEIVVINKGIGGSTSANGLRRFERDVIIFKPKYLVLYFGMNDALKAHIKLNEFKANLKMMLKIARKHNIKPILITLNPIIAELLARRYKADVKELITQNLAYDKAIREIAEESKTPLADLRKVIEENGGVSLNKNCLIGNPANGRGSDGIHLVARGYKKMAQVVAKVLKNDIQDKDIVVCLGDSITWGAGMKGAGTAYGECYPAWLYAYLNKAISGKKLIRPRPMPEKRSGNKFRNASFELVDPLGMPNLYTQNFSKKWSRIPIKSIAGIDVPDGKKYLKITAGSNETVVFRTNQFSLRGNENYYLQFNAKGHGQILMRLKFLHKINASPVKLSDDWIKLSSKWKKYNFIFKTPARVRVLVQIYAKGKVDLDNLYFGVN